MYSRAINLSDCLIPGQRVGDPVRFEPSVVLSTSPPQWVSESKDLSVRISDDQQFLELPFEVFLSKTYQIENKMLKIGLKKLNLEKLTITIQWKVIVEDLDCITQSLD